MIRSFFVTLFALTTLSSCLPAPTANVRTLRFVPGPAGAEIDPQTLLTRQIVPRDKLMTIPQAMKAAPIGSLMIVCWKGLESFWGPCSHITRKYSDTTLTDTVLLGEVTREYPLSHMYPRYAVIVLDTGIKSEMLPQMRTRAELLKGKPYDLSGLPGTYYCSTYQNELEEAMGLPAPIPFNKAWNIYMPAETLFSSGVKALYVGINPKAAYGYPGQTETETLDLDALEGKDPGAPDKLTSAKGAL